MKHKKLVVGLVSVVVVCLGVILVGLTHVETHAASNRYIKTSIDNTALFTYTDTVTQCRFVYDAVNRTIQVVKGYEHCTIPTTLD